MRIVVTGGSGKAGRWVVRRLREAGHQVLNVDAVHDGSPHGDCVLADLTDLGQCHEVVAGADAVVHLAAIPAPDIRPAGRDVPEQRPVDLQRVRRSGRSRRWAGRLGLERDRAWACRSTRRRRSPRSTRRTRRDRRRRTRCRSSSARRWRTSSRGSPACPSSGSGSRTSWSRRTTPGSSRGRTTRRSGSGTCGATSTRATWPRRSREASRPTSAGAEVAIVAAADTCMRRPSADLMAEVYPGVELRRPVEGRETLLAIGRARQLLGYEPAYSWLDPGQRSDQALRQRVGAPRPSASRR